MNLIYASDANLIFLLASSWMYSLLLSIQPHLCRRVYHSDCVYSQSLTSVALGPIPSIPNQAASQPAPPTGEQDEDGQQQPHTQNTQRKEEGWRQNICSSPPPTIMMMMMLMIRHANVQIEFTGYIAPVPLLQHLQGWLMIARSIKLILDRSIRCMFVLH